jgi:hypothetical protein
MVTPNSREFWISGKKKGSFRAVNDWIVAKANLQKTVLLAGPLFSVGCLYEQSRN